MVNISDAYIGTELDGGKYEIVQKIGGGAMGVVYKAFQPKLNRHVAIKIIHAKLAKQGEALARFKREVETLAQLTHPNTLRVFDDGVLEDGAPYIVTEFLLGQTLKQALETGPLSVDKAMETFLPLCEALEAAHKVGIVHRDLKPENIFLCDLGSGGIFPKVLDFGLAKIISQTGNSGANLTMAGTLLGTMEFMSPEQSFGRLLDHRSDIYSLGIIIYEALTGKLPFETTSNSELIEAHRNQPPIPLDQRVAGLVFPPLLPMVLDKALAKVPESRFASMTEFGKALAEAAGFSSGSSRQSMAPPSLSIPPVAKSNVSAPAHGQDVVAFSKASLIKYATIAFLLVAIGLVIAFLSGRAL